MSNHYFPVVAPEFLPARPLGTAVVVMCERCGEVSQVSRPHGGRAWLCRPCGAVVEARGGAMGALAV